MKKPIAQNTILTLDKDTGKILNAWGANMFFLPHMVKMNKFVFLRLDAMWLFRLKTQKSLFKIVSNNLFHKSYFKIVNTIFLLSL